MDSEFNALAHAIHKEIDQFGSHTLGEEALRAIWGDARLGYEKRMHIQNFAQRYGLKAVVNDTGTTATFTRPG